MQTCRTYRSLFRKGGRFWGELSQKALDKNGKPRYLFTKLVVRYGGVAEPDYSLVRPGGYISEPAYEIESHVWIYDARKMDELALKPGECVEFGGEVGIYRRKNGTYDLGILNVFDAKRIEKYEMPSEEDMMLDRVRRLICETCLMNDDCYGLFCMTGKLDLAEEIAKDVLAAKSSYEERDAER